jgi:hypothetical protein
MTDDPLDLATRPTIPLDDDGFTRAVLRRARVPAARRWWQLGAAAVAGAGTLVVVATVAAGPTALALGAVAAIAWALTGLGER